MSLTLDQLAVLDAIERHGSFAAAGRALHRATSAVSYAVRSLEETLGLELFDRSGHRAVLTKEGEAVLREGRDVLARAAALEDLSLRLRARWEPSIRVVVDGLLHHGAIMAAVRRFVELGAPTRLQLMMEYLSGVRERYDDAEADIMVCLPGFADPAGRVRSLPPVEMVLVAHRDHPLHRIAGPLHRAQLTDHVELVVADSGRRSPRAPPIPVGSPHVLRLPDFHSKREAIRTGIGFGWLPMHLAEEDLGEGTLATVSLESGHRHAFGIRLVERAGAVGTGTRAMVEFLAEELRRAK